MFWKFNYAITPKHRLMHGYHNDFYYIPDIATSFTVADQRIDQSWRQPDAEPRLHRGAQRQDLHGGALFGLLPPQLRESAAGAGAERA